MRIISLEYHDLVNDWHLEKAEFSQFSLLVGVSGAGKTMILRAIEHLVFAVWGRQVAGIQWDLRFETLSGARFIWQGKFEGSPDKKSITSIANESLSKDGSLIFKRDSNRLLIENQDYELGLASDKSVFALLGSDSRLDEIQSEMRLMSFMFRSSSFYLLYTQDEVKELGSDRILRGTLAGDVKLPLAFYYQRELFEPVRQNFLSIFPSVLDVRFFKPEKDNNLEHESISDIEDVEFQILEKNSKDWIGEEKISSGMLKIIHLLGFLHLANPGSVIVIDEFENSLGVNCIEILRELSASGLQFIITSHHPYIINNVSTKNWIFVSRTGNVVRTRSASQLDLPKSKHQAFQRLINSEEYQGIPA